MLVLGRSKGQSIVLTDSVSGSRVHILVVHVRGVEVKLGIEAPASVRVDRAEIDALRQQEGRP